MQRIQQFNHQAFNKFNLDPGFYRGLLICIAGTNAAGQTLAVTDLGTIQIKHFEQTIMEVTPEVLLNLTNLYGGIGENTSAVGAAYRFSFFIPFFIKNSNHENKSTTCRSRGLHGLGRVRPF